MKFYGEILIILLLLIANGRILFIKNVKKDSLVMLSPLAFFLSIIQILNWSFDWVTGLTLFLSILVLLSNFHALFRYSERLYIDHYSILMKVWSGITIILSLALLAGTIYFKPVEYDNKKLGVEETVLRYEGSFRSGFEDAPNYKVANVFLSEFKPVGNSLHTRDVILFIPDKRADTFYYQPYLQFLAREGFTVLSGDFYCSDCKWRHSIGDLRILRRTAMALDYFVNKQRFEMQKEFYTYNILQELKALLLLIDERYGENTRIFVVTDVMGTTAALDFMEKNPDRIMDVFDIQTVPEYKTPGLGLISQTDILLALSQGQSRDKNAVAAKEIVMQTKKEIFKARNTPRSLSNKLGSLSLSKGKEGNL